MKVSAGPHSLWRLQGKSHFCFFLHCGQCASIPWHVGASPQPCVILPVCLHLILPLHLGSNLHLLRRTPVTEFRAHPKPEWPCLDLITSAKSLFPSKVTFTRTRGLGLQVFGVMKFCTAHTNRHFPLEWGFPLGGDWTEGSRRRCWRLCGLKPQCQGSWSQISGKRHGNCRFLFGFPGHSWDYLYTQYKWWPPTPYLSFYLCLFHSFPQIQPWTKKPHMCDIEILPCTLTILKTV